jgi:hypothetical protein
VRDGCDDHDDDGIGGRRGKSGKSREEKESMASEEPELNGVHYEGPCQKKWDYRAPYSTVP